MVASIGTSYKYTVDSGSKYDVTTPEQAIRDKKSNTYNLPVTLAGMYLVSVSIVQEPTSFESLLPKFSDVDHTKNKSHSKETER